MSAELLLVAWKIGLVLLLVLVYGFFVSVQYAVVTIQASRIDCMADDGHLRTKAAKLYMSNPEGFVSICRLGKIGCSLLIGWLGQPALSNALGSLLQPFGFSGAAVIPVTYVLAFVLIVMAVVTAGDMFPRMIAVRGADHIALWSAIPMLVLYKIVFPPIRALSELAVRLLRAMGMEPVRGADSAHTEEQIRILMKQSHESGHIDNTELALVEQIFDFTDKTAREIRIPRTEMICLYANLSYEQNRAIAISEMHTRYPVCEPDKDSIKGFIHIKDLLKAEDEMPELNAIIRPITRVPESMQISVLLKLMQKKKIQIALLIDEYGGTSGLITFEDIIEEIVGEVQDEFDEERPRIEKVDDSTYSIDGRMLIEEVNGYFGVDIASDDYDTIGGWLCSQIDIPPKVSQSALYGQFRFVVEEADQLRICRITVKQRFDMAEGSEGEQTGV